MTDVLRGEYGVDGDFSVIPARWQAVLVTALCAALVAASVVCLVRGAIIAGTVIGVVAVLKVFMVASYLYTTRVGKFRVWTEILADLHLRGDETLLDLGCGRGATLLAAANLLPEGRAVGIDLWRADQTGNGPTATLRNAELEGVADRVELHTGDMTRLPFPDNTFDVVISSIAIHNIPSSTDRRAAIAEAVRVLRPGGHLAIADLLATKKHQAQLHELPVSDIHRRNVGPGMWWGGPWFPTRLLTATRTA